MHLARAVLSRHDLLGGDGDDALMLTMIFLAAMATTSSMAAAAMMAFVAISQSLTVDPN